MKKEKRFYRRPRPVGFFFASTVVAVCAALIGVLYSSAFPVPSVPASCLVLVIIICFRWMNSNRYKAPYLVANQYGIVINGLIKYVVPWSNIRSFDFVEKQMRFHSRFWVMATFNSLAEIRYNGCLSWFLHRFPLFFVWLRSESGTYCFKLHSQSAHYVPEVEQMIVELNELLEAAKGDEESATCDSVGISAPSGFVLGNVFSNKGLMGLILIFGLGIGVVLLGFDEDSLLIRISRFLGGGGVIVSFAPSLIYALSRKPLLEATEEGISIRRPGTIEKITWDNIKDMGFVVRQTKAQQEIVCYDSFYVDAVDPSLVTTRYPLGRHLSFDLGEFRHQNSPHHLFIGLSRWKRFPSDLAERVQRLKSHYATE